MGACMTRRRRTTDRVDLQTRRARRAAGRRSPDVSSAWTFVFGDPLYNLCYSYRPFTNELPGWRRWGVAVSEGYDPLDPDYDADAPYAYVHGGWNYDGPHVYPGWGGGVHGVDWSFDTDYVGHPYMTDHARGSEYLGFGMTNYPDYGIGSYSNQMPLRPRGLI